MTVINAVGSLPGLGRLLVGTMMDSAVPVERAEVFAKLLPEPLHTRENPFSNLDATLLALKDIGIVNEVDGMMSLVPEATTMLTGTLLTRSTYRKLLQRFMFASVDVDPWRVGTGDTLTSGTKDINRALSWSLAQDVRTTLTWNKTDGGSVSADLLQKDQLPNVPTLQPFANDVRWNNFIRWSTTLGMAQPAFQGVGIYPDATVAIRDVVLEMPPGRLSIDEFLDGITRRFPVVRGGALHSSFLQLSVVDPDPDGASGLLDTTLAQALLALEEEGIVSVLPVQADADSKTVGLGSVPLRRVTHVEVHGGSVE
jgi:hypothetical protein